MPDATRDGALWRMTPLVRAHAPRMLVSLALRTVNLGLGVVLLGLSGAWIARAILLGVTPTAAELGTLAAIGVTKAFARYGEQVTGHDAAFRILETLRNAIFAGFARRGVAASATDRSGDLVSRAMGDVELVEVYFAHTLAPVASALLFVGAAGLTVGALAGAAAGLSVLALLAVGGFAVPLAFQRAGARPGRDARARHGALSAEVAEGLAGVQDLLVAGAALRWQARIDAAGDALGDATRRLGGQAAWKDVLVDACLVASLFVVAAASAGDGVHPDQRVVLWGLACGLAGGFGAVLSVSRAVDDLPRSAAAAGRVLEIIESEPQVVDGPHPLRAERTPTVRVEGLTVRYPSGRGLTDVSLLIPPGEHVFVTGRSGCGKSTLAAALLGLLRPARGRVHLDDLPLDTIRGEDLRRVISAAGQALRPVPGTVAQNVALGLADEQATEIPAEAWSLGELDALAAALDEGAGTRLSGADERISGGQERRVGLARLVARAPRVVLLDEAFAGLDEALRRRLRAGLLRWARAAGRTVLEISHETAEAQDADRVVVLDDGRVVEDGSPSALLAAGGPFAALVRAERDVASPRAPA